MKNFRIQLIIVMFFMFCSVMVFANGTVSVGALGENALYEDANFIDSLESGCLVQLILDRDGDGLDSIEFTGSKYPTGDDIFLPIVSGLSSLNIGDGVEVGVKGQFSGVVVIDNEDPDPNYSGYKVYVRFWNSSNPETGSKYGEAGPFIIKDGLDPQEINITSDFNLYTDKLLREKQ